MNVPRLVLEHPTGAFVTMTLTDAGGLHVETHSSSRRQPKTDVYTPATVGEYPDAFAQAIVSGLEEKGYTVTENRLVASNAIRARLPLSQWGRVRQVLEAVELLPVQWPDELTPESGVVPIPGTQLSCRVTNDHVRILGTVATRLGLPVLLTNIAIVRCLDPQAEVLDLTDQPMVNIEQFLELNGALPPLAREALYSFGVLRRPLDLAKAFKTGTPSPFALGF